MNVPVETTQEIELRQSSVGEFDEIMYSKRLKIMRNNRGKFR